ncbi:MAG TPA: hypothetical protein PLG41_17345 [Leptospiraceae bacterium]|nr:hypothetical protein [Leptospiraceae bacterium]
MKDRLTDGQCCQVKENQEEINHEEREEHEEKKGCHHKPSLCLRASVAKNPFPFFSS